MSNRLHLDKDHLVVAKPGFDATNASLADGDKLFDSDWLFSSTIVEAGIHYDQASYRSPKLPRGNIASDESTNDWYTQVINFTPLPFVPTVLLLPLSDTRYWQEKGMVLLGVDKVDIWARPDTYKRDAPITVTNSQIIIPRAHGNSWAFREDFIYLIMAM